MLYIILPVYNEEPNLNDLLKGLKQISESAPLYVIPVDDGSCDSSLSILTHWHRALPMKIIRHTRNRGLGRALRSGIQTIAPNLKEEDVVVTMDADGSHPPETINKLVHGISDGFDIVIASRFVPGGLQTEVPLFRKILSRIVSVTTRICTGIRIRDITSGFRAYSGRVLLSGLDKWGDELLTEDGFVATPELLLKLYQLTAYTKEIPFHLHYERKKSKSKMRVFHEGVRYLCFLVRYCFRVGLVGSPS